MKKYWYSFMRLSETEYIAKGTIHHWNGNSWNVLEESVWTKRRFPPKPTKDEIYENRLRRSLEHKLNQSKVKR